MPIYEYECTKCDTVFEEEAPITAPPRQRCPQCRGKVKRLISGGSGILFKGSGFYVTDSRSAPGSEGGDKPATTESTDTKSTSAANDSTKGSGDKT